MFGFSRGAYTARSLCGFVKAAGLLQQPTMKDVWRAYMDLYATAPRIVARPKGWTPDRVRGWLVEKAGDAVGRLGDDVSHDAPPRRREDPTSSACTTRWARSACRSSVAVDVNEPIVGFHDTTLGDMVEHAVQALAVDEKRGPYVPTLWTQAANAAALAGQSVLQVWFPGVHSDIGGGYGDKGIGDIHVGLHDAAGRAPRPADRSGPAHAAGHAQAAARAARVVRQDLAGAQRQAEARAAGRAVHRADDAGARPARPSTSRREVRLHPALVSRFGKRCTTILDEGKQQQQEGDYQPGNVKADTLPAFA